MIARQLFRHHRARARREALLTPPLVALLLVANLVPAMALMVLFARRLALRRARRSPIGGRGRLHVRLVALFSVIASVPTLAGRDLRLATVSERHGILVLRPGAHRARERVQNARANLRDEHKTGSRVDLQAMGGDIVDGDQPVSASTSRGFREQLGVPDSLRGNSPKRRSSRSTRKHEFNTAGDRQSRRSAARQRVSGAEMLASCRPARHWSSLKTPRSGRGCDPARSAAPDIYLYASRAVNDRRDHAQIDAGAQRCQRLSERLLARSRTLQLRFNAALLLVSLLIVALAIWIALGGRRPAGAAGRRAGRRGAAGRRPAISPRACRLARRRTRSARSATPSTG